MVVVVIVVAIGDDNVGNGDISGGNDDRGCISGGCHNVDGDVSGDGGGSDSGRVVGVAMLVVAVW